MADEKLIEQVFSKVKINPRCRYVPEDKFDFGQLAGVPSPTNSAVKVLALSTPGIYMWQVNPQSSGEITVRVKIYVPSDYAGISENLMPMISLLGSTSDEKSPTSYDGWEEVELKAEAPSEGSMNLEIANMSAHDQAFVYVEEIEIV
jgi:hypothetical protein